MRNCAKIGLFLLLPFFGCSVEDTIATRPGGSDGCRESLSCNVGACYVLVPGCEGDPPPTCPPAQPASSDVCGDGIDNNCDGQVDEGCPCADGAQKACYTGSPITRAVGLCVDGVQICVGGAWSACEGAILPVQEECDQRDNDCDGMVDEGCSCNDRDKQSCYGGPESTVGIGGCRSGVQTCDLGAWSMCFEDVRPQIELCDGLDNDCNGVIDIDSPLCECVEGELVECYTGPQGTLGVGTCSAGAYTCVNGQLETGVCQGEVVPAPEVCDGLDNDCDGESDEGIPDIGQGCSSGLAGVCNPGTIFCLLSGLNCQPNIQPGTFLETCNGADDDCDGLVDEGPFCCPDSLKSGNETDVDCGGSCAQKCQIGQTCVVGSDCVSGVCSGFLCVAPICADGVQDGTETGVDCGGSCAPCSAFKAPPE